MRPASSPAARSSAPSPAHRAWRPCASGRSPLPGPSGGLPNGQAPGGVAGVGAQGLPEHLSFGAQLREVLGYPAPGEVGARRHT